MNQKVYALSREQVQQICQIGADKMKLARIKSLSFTDDGLPADDSTVKLFSVLRQEAKDVLITYATDADYQEYIDKREDVSPTEGKQRYGDVTFADAKNKKYPIDSEAHIRAAWSYVNMPKNAEKYDSGDLDVIKGHIVAAWKKTIDKAGPPSAGDQKNNDQIAEFGDKPGHEFHGNQYSNKALGHAQDALHAAKGGSKFELDDYSRGVKLSTSALDASKSAETSSQHDSAANKHVAAARYHYGNANDPAREAHNKAAAAHRKAAELFASQKNYAVAGLKSMTRQQVSAKCQDCAGKMAGNEQDMPVDAGGHMQHICGKGGRAVTVGTYADELQAAEYANNIKGVQIFRVGTHNGDQYTAQDLDDMVSAFKVLDYRPCLKLGHTKDTPGAPAYGWVQNLHRDGDKLIADFEDMHDSVVDAIRSRSYPNVSSEIYFNLKRGGKDYRRALKAVALLGAEVPAVAGLTPLHKMEFAESGFERIGSLEQALEVPSQALVDTLAERVAGLVNIMKECDMAKNTQKIAELKEKVEELNEQIVALNADGGHKVVAKGDMFHVTDPAGKKVSEHGTKDAADAAAKKCDAGMDDETKENAIKELSETATALEEEIHALEIDEDNTGAISALSKELSESKAREAAAKQETKELSERVARIESERQHAAVGAKVEACKIPAFRDSLKALYTYAVANVAAVVKVYSKDKDGKDVVADKSLVDVVDGMVGEINSQSEKLFKALAFSGQTARIDGTVEEDAGQEIQKRVADYRIKHPEVKLYEEAMTAVLKADDELATRYRAQLGQEQ